MVNISHLEWHISHACNFTCEQCCHFSNHGHSIPISYEQIEKWYSDWAPRIAPATIDILGGEPLLNKRICDIVELTRKKWDKPNLERLDITTNGVLLYISNGYEKEKLEMSAQIEDLSKAPASEPLSHSPEAELSTEKKVLFSQKRKGSTMDRVLSKMNRK